MTSFRLRPRFKFKTKHSCDQIKTRIEAKLEEGNKDCFAEYSNHHIFLKISPKDQHYWSPQLDLTCEPLEDEEGIIIKGLYGPHPHVWTFFMFSYLGLATIAIFVGLIGLARLSLGLSSLVLWVVPGLGLIGLILYISSQLGQKVGVEQTFVLHHFLEEVLEERIHVH